MTSCFWPRSITNRLREKWNSWILTCTSGTSCRSKCRTEPLENWTVNKAFGTATMGRPRVRGKFKINNIVCCSQSKENARRDGVGSTDNLQEVGGLGVQRERKDVSGWCWWSRDSRRVGRTRVVADRRYSVSPRHHWSPSECCSSPMRRDRVDRSDNTRCLVSLPWDGVAGPMSVGQSCDARGNRGHVQGLNHGCHRIGALAQKLHQLIRQGP